MFLYILFVEIAEHLDTYLDIIFYLTILCIFSRGNFKVLIMNKCIMCSNAKNNRLNEVIMIFSITKQS